jgi:hypothetical protein
MTLDSRSLAESRCAEISCTVLAEHCSRQDFVARRVNIHALGDKLFFVSGGFQVILAAGCASDQYLIYKFT